VDSEALAADPVGYYLMTPIVFSVVVPGTVLAVGVWAVLRLTRQQGRILARLESLDREFQRLSTSMQRRGMKDSLAHFMLEQQRGQPPSPPAGLKVGVAAPDFDLTDLAGRQHQLESFRGRKMLLIFMNPGCGYCVRMAPDLAALPSDGGNGRPVPVAIVSGSADAMRQLAAEHNLRCPMLLDADGRIGTAYEMNGTPTGYLIDESGRIASPYTAGAPDLLALAEKSASAGPKGKVNRGLEHSKINRSGLKAGTPAPAFRLPKVGGGDLALEELRGRPVLLIFSDPECGPCNALASRLEPARRGAPDVQMVIVSRRDEVANRKKAEELGLRVPVVLQKQWEISRLYGIFETPVGYLVDENGVIAHDVAKGAEAILDLLSASASALARQPLALAA
jgi:peroxiredoxin